jgi:hypothetical protein
VPAGLHRRGPAFARDASRPARLHLTSQAHGSRWPGQRLDRRRAAGDASRRRAMPRAPPQPGRAVWHGRRRRRVVPVADKASRAVAPDRAHHAASPRRHRRGIGCPRQAGNTQKRATETLKFWDNMGFATPILDTRRRTAARHRHRRCSEGQDPVHRVGRFAYLGSSGSATLFGVSTCAGAGSRSALPLRFSVIFEYGGLIP